MTHIAVLMFGATALIAIAVNSWLPPKVALGRPFWILTFILSGLPLILLGLSALAGPVSRGSDAFLIVGTLVVFAPVAAGWLLGVLVSSAVRYLRAKSR
jgi:hypothetical protein